MHEAATQVPSSRAPATISSMRSTTTAAPMSGETVKPTKKGRW
jgi:hypothetical protein